MILTLDDGHRKTFKPSQIDYYVPDTEGCWIKIMGHRHRIRVLERYKEIQEMQDGASV